MCPAERQSRGAAHETVMAELGAERAVPRSGPAACPR